MPASIFSPLLEAHIHPTPPRLDKLMHRIRVSLLHIMLLLLKTPCLPLPSVPPCYSFILNNELSCCLLCTRRASSAYLSVVSALPITTWDLSFFPLDSELHKLGWCLSWFSRACYVPWPLVEAQTQLRINQIFKLDAPQAWVYLS